MTTPSTLFPAISDEQLTAIVTAEVTSPGAGEFFRRVWSTPMETYLNRLRAIEFEGLGRVLDAGCGFGQWLPALAALNGDVTGIEYDGERVRAARRAMALTGCAVSVDQGSIESLPYPDGSFDAVFSYSVVLCTDYRRSLGEFARVLKPGGKLYFNTNGLGWYLHNLIDGHNSTAAFSSRQMSVDAIRNTITYLSSGRNEPGKCLIMPRELTEAAVEAAGLRTLAIAGEGCINPRGLPGFRPFFPGEHYGMDSVYELLCLKPGLE